MQALTRIGSFIAFGASAAAATWSFVHMQGDVISYEVPRANEAITYAQAVYLEQAISRGLRLNPTEPEAILRRAGHLAAMGRRAKASASPESADDAFNRALDRLEEARRYFTGMQAFLLEAGIHHVSGEDTLAIERYERLHRISPVDRSVTQALIELYSKNGQDEELRALAAELDARWPDAFDTLVALAHIHMEDSDAPMILRYFLLAANAPNAGTTEPSPRVFEYADAKARIVQASRLLSYESEWARWH